MGKSKGGRKTPPIAKGFVLESSDFEMNKDSREELREDLRDLFDSNSDLRREVQQGKKALVSDLSRD